MFRRVMVTYLPTSGWAQDTNNLSDGYMNDTSETIMVPHTAEELVLSVESTVTTKFAANDANEAATHTSISVQVWKQLNERFKLK